MLAMMGGRSSQRRGAYREFVEGGLAQADEEFREALKAPGLAIGDEGFRQWVERLRGKTLKQRKQKQDVAFRKVVATLDPAVVMREVAHVFGVEEAVLKQRRRQPPEQRARSRKR